MSEFVIVSIILLGIVLLDAIGDGLRWIGKQMIHHAIEALREAIWLAMVVYFTGNYTLIPIYITARIALFDPLINLVAGKGLGYVGSNSIYDRTLKLFMSWIEEPKMLIWVIRVMALIAFVVLILTR
jgi:hypothetical protein